MHARVFLLAVLLLALGASPALAGGSHLLHLYKVEKHVDLAGEGSAYTIACHGTDIATDGMWRIDNVDQDNEFTRLELLRSVSVIDARPLDDSSYEFSFLPVDGGDVQVKLWVTCLGRQTEPDDHQHTWVLTQQQVVDPHLALPAGPAEFDHTTTCAPGEIAVQPGWRLTTPDGTMTTFRSWPTPTFRGRHYAFLLDQPSDVRVYLSCLRLRSTVTLGHAHRIVQRFVPGFAGSQRTLPVDDDKTEQQVHCGDLYKGMVGAWWINDPFHVWFFGMDPRIKTRAYWFGNDGGGDSRVFVGLTCFKDKTT